MSEDTAINDKTRIAALGQYTTLNTLENCFMTVVWYDVLHRFDAVNKLLQAEATDLSKVIEQYAALVQFVTQMREKFDDYERNTIEKSGLNQYKSDIVRARTRRQHFDESNEEEAVFSARDNFRVKTFLVIIDRLSAELSRRSESYKRLYEKFGFLSKLRDMTSSAISENSKRLVETYPEDLEESLDLECEHLKAHFIATDVQCPSITELNKMFHDKSLAVVYPNLNIALRIYFSIPATNCTAERSFSALKRIKNYLRSTISENRLNSLAIMNIESDLTRSLNFDDLISKFAQLKVRRGFFN